ncbi:E3 ubiquitin-protein ligase MARCH5-like [Drosophila serrata]|uniref:E3 ubiquitin-protein ligase MARCH5-like n=1 Tax=Drosophila serrata TaxID=7274 RepID=UPI000A1D24DF|nr:E3 ubiquitin-protein ligase MARCH5-like [Drosophila serrata]
MTDEGITNIVEGSDILTGDDDDHHQHHTVAVVAIVPKPIATDAANTETMAMIMTNDENEPERCCWICFATEDEDNHLAAWLNPCQCRGTTKWVHQSCLYRWIDEKMNSNQESGIHTVSCPQCKTEYIIVYPRIGHLGMALEALDIVISGMCSLLTSGIIVCWLYWTAVTFGAVTFLQVVGHDNGMAIMQSSDPILLLIGLPIIPIGLIVSRLIRWDDAILHVIQGRRTMADNNEQQDENGYLSYRDPPLVSESTSVARIFCGALLLPTISSIVGRILFDSVKNTFHRTLLGGITFITAKGILKIYLRHRQYASRRNRHVVDYTEENLRNQREQNSN